MKHWVIWGSVACLGFIACGGDDDAPPQPEAAGQGGGGEAAGRGGEGGAGHVIGPAGSPGDGGSGGVIVVGGGAGQGGGAGAPIAACEQGLQRLRIVEDAGLPELASHGSVTSVVSWPEQQRVAVNLSDQIAIFDLEPESREGVVHLVQLLAVPELAVGGRPDSFRYIFPDGEGLIVVSRQGQVLSWQPEGAFSSYAGADTEGIYNFSGALADATHGLVIASPGSVHRPRLDPIDGEWSWQKVVSVPGRRLQPLAFDGDTVLVGVGKIAWGEPGYGDAGGAGAGGAGGAPFGPEQARLERWSLAGKRLASYGTVGDPSVAVPARSGWLIGETNSFFGSYRAAVHWLNPNGKLEFVASVPVQSSGDGTDGAYDIAVHGDDLLVANCESGLLRGRWDGAVVQLKPVPGPWSPDFAECSPKQVEVVGDVMVVAGPGLDFVRFCD